MRHLEKRALSLLLALLLCLTLFPATAVAEEGTISPVEDGEDGGLSGTPAPTEEDEPGTIVGDGVLDVPYNDPAALPQEPTADEIQEIVASGTCGENLTWTLDVTGLLTISGIGAMTDWSNGPAPCYAPWYSQKENIKEVRIEDGVTSIGDYAFEGCSSLTSVTIPDSVTSIGGSAFSACSSLADVTIPDSMTSIGGSAFAVCSSLTSVTIPSSVTSIGDMTFFHCSSLIEIQVEEGNKCYASVDGVLYDAEVHTLLQCPGGKGRGITIPAGVIAIESWAFSHCTSLTSVTIPESVTSIGNYAFTGCSRLMSVTIPESVTSIGYIAFRGCSSLTSVTIPAGITSIGTLTFSDCSSLKSVLFMGNAPSIDVNAFDRTCTTTVYPIDNSTWTYDKRQNYGGLITWVGYRDEAKAYTIHFDPNGGSNAPEDQIKGHNVDITLTRAVPSRDDATFLGWSTRSGAAEPDYLPGDSFSLNADTTLYAVWKQEAPVLPTEAVLSLGNARVCAGQEFTVDLSMEKNPGLMFLSFTLDYDAASLEFLGAEEVLFTGWTVNKEKNFLTWDADGDRRDNGTLLRLRFLAKEEAGTGETAIALTDLFATNYAEELLGIGSVPGEVMILPHTPGDVNGDGAVDGRDLVRLRKFLVGVPGTEIIEANANVNGDDVIDILDLIRLRKYLAKDDVILE